LSTESGVKLVDDLSGNQLGSGALWSASTGQTFEFPGRVSLRKAIANRQIGLAQLGYESFRVALANRVRSLGYRALAAQDKAGAAREVTQRFQELLSVLSQRDTAGVAPLIDLRIIEANAIALDRRANEAAQEMTSAIFELNQLRGAPIETPLALAKSEPELEALPALETLFSVARERNFDVRTRIAEFEQRGFQVKLAKNERWPAVTLGPALRGERANSSELYPTAGISLPLPLWNRNAGNIETARARQFQAEVSITVTLRDVERKIAAAASAYRSQLEQLAKWKPDAIKQLREAAELGDRSYRDAALPIATYIQLQQQYLEAHDAIVRTQAQALESRQQIELLTGLNVSGSQAIPPHKRTETSKKKLNYD
jgi:cobalt-zinc-cadmium efflux system outer membrane protein